MPTFTLTKIKSELEALPDASTAKEITEADKKKDDAVVEVLKKGTKIIIDNAKLHDNFVATQRDNAKSTLASMETKLNQIKEPNYIPNPYTVPEIKAGIDIIKANANAGGKSSSDQMAANAEYRASWDLTAKKKLKDPARLGVYQAMRLKSINDNKTSIALVDRLQEYITRAELIHKTATTLTASAAASGTELTKEVAALTKQVTDNMANIEKLIIQVEGKCNRLEEQGKPAKIETKLYPVIEGIAKHIEADRKSMSGAMKTLKSQVELLRKLATPRAFIFKTNLDTATKALALEPKVQTTAKTAEKAIALLPSIKAKAKG